MHEYIQLFATKTKPKSKSALKTPDTEKAESAKKRVQQEQQRSLNALRPTPTKEPPRANSNRPTITHTSPPTATPVTPLARPLSCQVNSQLDPRRRPSSSSSNPVSLPVHPSVLDLLKDKTKENERPRLNFVVNSSGESEDENDLANILK